MNEQTETEKTLKGAADDFDRGIGRGEPAALVGAAVKVATTPISVVKDVAKAIFPW